MPSTSSGARTTLGRATIWVLVVVELVGMGAAGLLKFVNPELWTGLFLGWGYPAWFTFVVGAAEVFGVLLLLVPRLAGYGAVLLMVIMLGALGTVLTHPGQMGPTTPAVHLVVLAVILWARWPRRWRPGKPRDGSPPTAPGAP